MPVLELLAVAAASAGGADILVSARVPVTAAASGASVSVLTGADLARLQSPLLADVLRLQPGVTISSNGGPGAFTAVRLRGAEGEQTTLVIDGVKVADTASPGGGADFANLQSGAVGRVEVLRGPQSLAWGSQAIGGVVAVETLAPGEAPSLAARLEAGSRNSFLARADGGARLGPVALSGGANWQRTDGISAASETRGNVERDDFESWGGALRADVALGGGFVADLRGRFQQSDTGIDGFPPPNFTLADTDERQWTRELSRVLGLGWRGADGGARIGWQASDIDRRSYAPGQGDSFVSEGRLERLDFRGDWRLSDWLTLAGGAEREVSRIRTEDAFTPQPFTARATLEGLWGQALLRPVAGLNVAMGLRHDEHSRFGGATTWAASGAWQAAAPLKLRASYGEGFKAPTLFQLFSDFGNPGLQPETAAGWDAGADLAILDGAVRASATWFSRVTRNQIDFVSCFGSTDPICTGRPFGTYDNVGRTRAKGGELQLGATPVEGLDVGVQATLLDARNATAGSANDGNRLARRPGETLALVADYAAPAGWSLGATVALVSDSFDDAANRRRIEGHVTADLRASVALSRRLELYGRVSNLFDEVYETASFYGQPGRQAFVGLRARH